MNTLEEFAMAISEYEEKNFDDEFIASIIKAIEGYGNKFFLEESIKKLCYVFDNGTYTNLSEVMIIYKDSLRRDYKISSSLYWLLCEEEDMMEDEYEEECFLANFE